MRSRLQRQQRDESWYAEQELASERLRTILDTANDAFIAIDSGGIIIDWNPQAERIFGYTRHDALGSRLVETLIPPRYRVAHQAGLERYLATGIGPVLFTTLELSALRRTGEEFPIELTIWPMRIGDDITFNAFVRDITQRKRIEGFMQLQRTIAVAANEAATAEDAFRRCLEEVCALTGWPVGHVYERPEGADHLVPTSIWYLDDHERYQTFRTVTEASPLKIGVGLPGRVLPSGKPAWIVDVTKDGNFPRARAAIDIGVRGGFAFPVKVGAEVVAVLEFFSPAPKVPDEALLDVMADIGTQLGRVVERERSLRELRRAFASLRAAEEVKDLFLEGVSHEMRTPLSVLIGMASLLAEHGDRLEPGQGADLARRLVASAGKLERLLSDLLDLRELTQGTLSPRRRPTEIRPHIERVVSSIDTGSHRLTIVASDVRASVDPAQLDRIVHNLVANAIRHTPPGTDVWVRASTDGGELRIVVEDAGPGIPDALKERIFEPFVRIDPDDPNPGTGIGLSLVARFAELHAGRAWVEDRARGGAAFTVVLPDD
jgi:PAS domain S-box-containing protein